MSYPIVTLKKGEGRALKAAAWLRYVCVILCQYEVDF